MSDPLARAFGQFVIGWAVIVWGIVLLAHLWFLGAAMIGVGVALDLHSGMLLGRRGRDADDS